MFGSSPRLVFSIFGRIVYCALFDIKQRSSPFSMYALDASIIYISKNSWKQQAARGCLVSPTAMSVETQAMIPWPQGVSGPEMKERVGFYIYPVCVSYSNMLIRSLSCCRLPKPRC